VPVNAVENKPKLLKEMLKAAAETHEITVVLPKCGLAKVA